MKMIRGSTELLRAVLLVLGAACICITGCAHLSGLAEETECEAPLAPVINAPVPNSAGYLQHGPLVQGDLVSGPARKTATERLLELTAQLGGLQQQVTTLRQQIGSLESEVANKDRSLRQARQEIEQATSSLGDCQRQFDAWHQEAAELRAYISQQDHRHAAAVASLSQRLEKLIAQYEDEVTIPEIATEISLGPVNGLGL